jgi:dihydrofolate synthase/folylpolyglutamate synthase
MLEQLLPHFQHVVFTRYLNNPRAMDPDKLLALAQSIQQSHGLSQLTLHVRPNPEAAWRLIESLASPAHLVCITGSFFLAAETRQYAESPGRVAMGCS